MSSFGDSRLLSSHHSLNFTLTYSRTYLCPFRDRIERIFFSHHLMALRYCSLHDAALRASSDHFGRVARKKRNKEVRSISSKNVARVFVWHWNAFDDDEMYIQLYSYILEIRCRVSVCLWSVLNCTVQFSDLKSINGDAAVP